jgi:hypothetical protein|eukprot:COSAG06_NODE_7773_length_2379_cov_1.265235_2_plen_138_part_00
MVILPRQARDKQREGSTKKEHRFCRVHELLFPALPLAEIVGAKAVFVFFLEFSLCLSSACLGKMIVFVYKLLKNAGFVGAKAEAEKRPSFLHLLSFFLHSALFLFCFVPSLSWSILAWFSRHFLQATRTPPKMRSSG